jgi:hypothetical protein
MNPIFALSAQSDTSFFEDVWNYLYDVYLRSEGSYSNLGLEKMPLFSIRLTVLGIFIGIIIACIAMAYHKMVLGGIVRKLIEKECLSPESALSAEELGYGRNFLKKNALERSVSLRSIVRCAEEEEFLAAQEAERSAHDEKRKEDKSLKKYKTREYVIDANSDRFYIPEDKRILAEIKFEKKGSGWVSTAFAIVGVLILFFVVLLVLPQILTYIDDLLA